MAFEILVTTDESEIVNSRIFNVAADKLFKAWSTSELLSQWWGPKGFTNTFHVFDFKVGGQWKFTMHGPEKGNYQNECTFLVIEENKRIAWQRISKPIFQILATFEALDENKTLLVFKMLFETVDECQKLKPYVVDKNEENFDKLELLLSSM